MSALILATGALCSTVGTLAVKASHNFRRLGASILALACYGGGTWFLAQAMLTMPVALAHAVWSGLVAIALLVIDKFYFKTRISRVNLAGFSLVLLGIVLLGAN